MAFCCRIFTPARPDYPAASEGFLLRRLQSRRSTGKTPQPTDQPERESAHLIRSRQVVWAIRWAVVIADPSFEALIAAIDGAWARLRTVRGCVDAVHDILGVEDRLRPKYQSEEPLGLVPRRFGAVD
jgi:hypothetical protein